MDPVGLASRFLFPFGFLWRTAFKEKRTPCEKANFPGKGEKKEKKSRKYDGKVPGSAFELRDANFRS